MNECEFLEGVRELIQEFRIQPVKIKTSDKNARRIALLIGEKYLSLWTNEETNRFQIAADCLMTKIYQAVRKLNLSCDIIPEEARVREEKLHNFDVLKIGFLDLKPTKLSTSVLLILKEANSGNSKPMGRKVDPARNVSTVSKL